MTAWLRRGAAAATLAGERGDLWPAGALAWLIYAGWLPLLLVVAPPNGSDVEYFGVSLVTSGSYPANVIALSAALVAGFCLLLLLASACEVALAGAVRRAVRHPQSGAALGGLAILLLATVPVIVAGVALVLEIISVAPGVYTSPDVSTPVLLRLGAAVFPYLVAAAVGLVVGQVFGGLALRLLVRDPAHDTAAAIAGALRRLARDPWGPLGVALVGTLKDLLLTGVGYLVLALAWRPVSESIQVSRLTSPPTLLLLVGFVGIWLALVMVGGTLHAIISTWWLAEVSPVPPPEGHRSHADAQPHPVGGGSR